jgi:hypothetical protein
MASGGSLIRGLDAPGLAVELRRALTQESRVRREAAL